jgi:phosphatidylinositol-3,4,5-trisphosphate 3-phosphatase/dual-specificity protein phosphatase PTEN
MALFSAGLQFVISEGNKKVYSSECYEVKKGQTQLAFRVGECQAVKGDIKIEFFNKQKLRKEKLFHFWFVH